MIGAISHRDEGEEGSAHIHAMVIPITEGRLCAKEFMNGRAHMRNMQTSYAEQMKPLGLERGIEAAAVEHEDMKHFRGALKKEVLKTLPRPEKDEPVLDYFDRANEEFFTSNAKNFDKIKKLEREIVETKAHARDALRSEREWYLAQIKSLQKENQEKKRRNKELSKENAKLKESANEYAMLKRGLANFSDKAKAEIIKKGIDQLVKEEKEREKNKAR